MAYLDVVVRHAWDRFIVNAAILVKLIEYGICSLAHAALQAPSAYVRPQMTVQGKLRAHMIVSRPFANLALSGTGDLVIKDGRHPCLEVQDDVDFIPNDTQLLRGERIPVS